MVDREVINVKLTAEQRALILRYGCPFDGIEQSLKACRGSRGIETVPVDTFELERLIGDLSIAINALEGGAVQHKLLDLCDHLESAERQGNRHLDRI